MKNLMLTTSWDDGHVLDLRIAELLKKYKLSGTFYVSPKCRELKFKHRLDNKQICNLATSFEIGAHTMTHPHLTKLSPSEAEKEIRNSKHYLERIIGKKIISFCYPGGIFTKEHKNIVKNTGFRYARTVKRFSLKTARDNFAAPTTIHAYKHYQDIPRIILLGHLKPFLIFKLFQNWDELAKFTFDRALKNGGVYHLWGHSWEIDTKGDWTRLENVLRYISRRQNVRYIKNSDLVK
jgi:peptidoglycan/xylan/chitin deacetylase (PgdA/CDA1 family)